MQRGVSVGAKSGGRDDGGNEEEVRREKESGGERGPGVGGFETRAHTLRGKLLMIETPF